MVHCQMRHVHLQVLPPYEAMSYTWGRKEKTRTIYINNKPFRTTENVYNLLYDRSPIWSTRTIWLDYVCINQDDDDEKSVQTQMMRDIYKLASRVTVWLGDALDSRAALNMLTEMAKWLHKRQYELYTAYTREQGTKRWLAFNKLISHAYFSRVWMIQEVAVNKTLFVVYGTELLPWDLLAAVMTRLHSSIVVISTMDDYMASNDLTPIMKAIKGAELLWTVRQFIQDPTEARKVKGQIRELVTASWDFEATDPRDKIFALVGISNEAGLPAFRPNYRKTVEEVYVDFARYLFSQQDALPWLSSYCGIGWRRNVTAIPSWVPDWSHVGRTPTQKPPLTCGSDGPSGSISQRPAVIDDRNLKLDAILVGSVVILGEECKPLHRSATTGAPHTAEDIYLGRRSWLVDIYTRVAAVGIDKIDIYPTGETAEDALWRTLVFDNAHFSEAADDLPANQSPTEVYRYAYRCAVQMVLGGPVTPENYHIWQQEVGEISQYAMQWIIAARTRCMGRRFGISSSGYFGVFPTLSEVGDVIAVIPGVPLPCLLRRSGHGSGNTYQLVGESYVHGIMSGEMARPDAVEEIVLV